MVLIDDNGNEGFSFIWTIQNYTYCIQRKHSSIISPNFKVETGKRDNFYLELFPMKTINCGTIGLFLRRPGQKSFSGISSFALSIRTVKGTFKKVCDLNVSSYDLIEGHSDFVEKTELQKDGSDGFLEDGTLTLRCRIWKVDDEPISPGQCHARTIIGVEKSTFSWSMENFDDVRKGVMKIPRMASDIPSFTMYLSGDRNSFGDEKLIIEVRQTNTSDMVFFTTCRISMLGSGGRIVHLVRDENWFERTRNEQVWMIPVIQISKFDNLYLPNGTLTLICVFSVSSGIKYSQIENCQYGELNDLQHESFTVPDSEDTLKDDLFNLFLKEYSSDVTVRITNKTFPVHKTILSARSEVFRAMFEHDTKESQTGIVEIVDLDDETVSKLLKFIYTDLVEDLGWESATNLYFAADKYAVTALKRKCSTFLKSHINSLNVCEILVLGDLHMDEELKSVARDYVFRNVNEITNSEAWKRLMTENLSLASETLNLFIQNSIPPKI